MAMKAVQAVGVPAAQAVGKVFTGDGNFTQKDDTATANNAAPESAEQGVNAVQALPESNQKANIGLDQAGRIENEIGTPVGDAIKKTGLSTTPDARTLIDETHQDYNNAVEGAKQATLNAEKALQQAADGASINPQAYMESLGVGGGLMTAIGLALSGLGSAVAGQPSAGLALYQKNFDAAIAAQAQTFKNLMEVSAQKQGLIKTAQDKQQIAANAYNMAVMSVATGANVAVQGTQMQVKSATAPYTAAQIQNINNQALSTATDNHSKQFGSSVQSQDARRSTIMGDGAQAVGNYLLGRPQSPASKGVDPSTRTGRPIPGGQAPSTDGASTFSRDLQLRQQKQRAEEEAIMESQKSGFKYFPETSGPLTNPQTIPDPNGQALFEGDSSKSKPKSFLDTYGDKK